MKPRRSKRTDRAGYALVLFLMMVLGLMGLAALVIDLGFARLAQRQMQTAVDSSALEGLRWRDVEQWEDLPQGWLADADFQAQVGVSGMVAGSMSTQQCEKVRRWAASRMAANTFDDDLEPTNGDTGQFGAGPVVDFTGGVGPPELAASQTMSPGVPPVYKPKRADGTPGLELNSDDAQNGDMTSGTYGSNPGYDVAHSADEDANYNRRDFQNTSNQAFLVRMRRTPLSNVPGSLDDTPGSSSSGPTIPFLFGRGTTMYQQAGVAYSPRRDGIEVRATAIAAAGDSVSFDGGKTSYSFGRAKVAGPPPTDSKTGNPIGIPGITPFALSWNGQTSIHVASDGSITGGGQIIQPTLIEIGQQVSKSVTGKNAAWLSLYVSANGTSQGNYAGPTLLALSQYVPVVDVHNTIIGFGYVRNWTWTVDATGGGTLSITLGPSGSVGSGNVSGIFAPGLTQDTTDFVSLFQAHATFNNPLYAPVLVNRFIGPQRSNP